MAISPQRVPDRIAAYDSPFGAMGIAAVIFLIIGGLNWGLVGALNFDLVATLFGEMTVASRAVYLLVGVAALVGIGVLMRMLKGPR